MAVVDVIIPTRNRLTLTLEAVESVRSQTFTDWHLYVVDDASSDASADGLASALDGDERVTLIRRRTQGGSNAARQAGFAAGRGDWVAILDSDDLWLPKKLELQVASAEHTGAAVVWCGHYYSARGRARDLRVG